MELFCKTCKKTMNEKNFYQSHNLEKYPTGHIDQCKSCLTMFVDNFDPETYVWILQELDVPYIPKQWENLVRNYCGPDKKVTGTTVLGRYLSKMKLGQWKDFRWKDNQFIQDMENSKIKAAMKQQGYDAAEIAQAVADEQKKIDSMEEIQRPDAALMEAALVNGINAKGGGANASLAQMYSLENLEQDIKELGLTEDDVTYLRLKWGKTYKPEEWVRLEQHYEEMMASYDIQTAGHIDTLKLICKTSLKANQLIDLGDIDGYQKMSKTYNDLMKSGKFTAAQNKDEQGEAIDSLGELFAICETKGFIPRYYIEKPNDKVDETLEDMKRYTKTLVTEELNLGNLIEQAVKDATKEDTRAEQNDLEIEEDSNIRDVEQKIATQITELEDSDYIDFNEELEEWFGEDNGA